MLASGGLALVTTPEAFLVLWDNQSGISVAWVPLLWVCSACEGSGLGAVRVLLLIAFAWLPDGGITWVMQRRWPLLKEQRGPCWATLPLPSSGGRCLGSTIYLAALWFCSAQYFLV
ncbi:MAG: hypothetical protein DRR06_15055 [Gammaproteobacteria bacterium]|nr:MAG: hypothetical protein DRR06_15055 [Gammaproteobacteria bacterium]